jgi:uncharacterized membrane protein
MLSLPAVAGDDTITAAAPSFPWWLLWVILIVVTLIVALIILVLFVVQIRRDDRKRRFEKSQFGCQAFDLGPLTE